MQQRSEQRISVRTPLLRSPRRRPAPAAGAAWRWRLLAGTGLAAGLLFTAYAAPPVYRRHPHQTGREGGQPTPSGMRPAAAGPVPDARSPANAATAAPAVQGQPDFLRRPYDALPSCFPDDADSGDSLMSQLCDHQSPSFFAWAMTTYRDSHGEHIVWPRRLPAIVACIYTVLVMLLLLTWISFRCCGISVWKVSDQLPDEKETPLEEYIRSYQTSATDPVEVKKRRGLFKKISSIQEAAQVQGQGVPKKLQLSQRRRGSAAGVAGGGAGVGSPVSPTGRGRRGSPAGIEVDRATSDADLGTSPPEAPLSGLKVTLRQDVICDEGPLQKHMSGWVVNMGRTDTECAKVRMEDGALYTIPKAHEEDVIFETELEFLKPKILDNTEQRWESRKAIRDGVLYWLYFLAILLLLCIIASGLFVLHGQLATIRMLTNTSQVETEMHSAMNQSAHITAAADFIANGSLLCNACGFVPKAYSITAPSIALQNSILAMVFFAQFGGAESTGYGGDLTPVSFIIALLNFIFLYKSYISAYELLTTSGHKSDPFLALDQVVNNTISSAGHLSERVWNQFEASSYLLLQSPNVQTTFQLFFILPLLQGNGTLGKLVMMMCIVGIFPTLIWFWWGLPAMFMLLGGLLWPVLALGVFFLPIVTGLYDGVYPGGKAVHRWYQFGADWVTGQSNATLISPPSVWRSPEVTTLLATAAVNLVYLFFILTVVGMIVAFSVFLTWLLNKKFYVFVYRAVHYGCGKACNADEEEMGKACSGAGMISASPTITSAKPRLQSVLKREGTGGFRKAAEAPLPARTESGVESFDKADESEQPVGACLKKYVFKYMLTEKDVNTHFRDITNQLIIAICCIFIVQSVSTYGILWRRGYPLWYAIMLEFNSRRVVEWWICSRDQCMAYGLSQWMCECVAGLSIL